MQRWARARGGASCVYVVTFYATALGGFGATLSLPLTDAAGTALPVATFAFSGTGVAPLSFSPSPLALGDVVVGSSGGVTKTLMVTNLTSQNITLGGFGLDKKVAASGKWKLVVRPVYQQSGQPKNTSDCSAGLALVGGASCVYVVTFYATALGGFGATLSLPSTDAAGTALPVATFAFSGTGVAPLSFSPSPLALGDVVVGSSGGVTKTLMVTNLTSQNITLGALRYDRTTSGTGAGTIRFTVDASESTCGVGVLLGRVGESKKFTKSCDFVVTFTVSRARRVRRHDEPPVDRRGRHRAPGRNTPVQRHGGRAAFVLAVATGARGRRSRQQRWGDQDVDGDEPDQSEHHARCSPL